MSKRIEREILDITKKLIEFESIASKPEELANVVDFVHKYLKENTSLYLKRFKSKGKPSLVGTFKRTKTPKIFLHAHLDVVPGKPEQFKPLIKNGKLYGRGASDTKGNGATLLVLAKELSELEEKPDVGFMFTTDEEIGGFNGARFLLEKGYKCEFFITMEPTDFDIVNVNKGILWVKVRVLGKTAHGSRPWQGENAAIRAYEGLTRLYRVFPLQKKESWKTTVNLGGISGGDAFNKVIGDCELLLDIRYVEEHKPEYILKKTKECFKDSSVEVVEKEPMMNSPKDSRYIKSLRRAVNSITGSMPKVRKSHGGSDGRHYSGVGIPAITFGTVSSGIHTDNEWLKIDKLEDFYKILYQFVA